jgi:hypothetical protein
VEQVLQHFEKAVRDSAGAAYRVYVYGRSRPGDTWQGWLVFERMTDGRRFSTGVETTQPSSQAIVYWAGGLSEAYFEGALQRAKKPVSAGSRTVRVPPPVVGGDRETRRSRLAVLEREVLDCFRRHDTRRLTTQTLFDELPHSHADVVRALEDLEKQGGLVDRRTEEGSDWVFLADAAPPVR